MRQAGAAQAARDGRLALLHDATLGRTTDGRGRVTAKTFDELRRLDAGSWFPKRALGKRRALRRFAGAVIPSLEELFDVANERNMGLYLEIKAPCAPGAEKVVIAAVHTAGALARSTVICFDPSVLGRVHKLDPEITLGYLFDKRLPDAVARATSAGAVVILPRVDRVTVKLIAEARRHNLKVITWTVDDPKRMKQLMAFGVDGIMSNYPDRLASVVHGE